MFELPPVLPALIILYPIILSFVFRRNCPLDFERELFLQCVHRAALVTSEKSNSVKIKLSANLLEITASSPDFGESHESMAISYSGPDLQVAFNPQFVMDPLRALTKDEVFFEVKDEVSPGVFKTLENFVCVIMPVRLS